MGPAGPSGVTQPRRMCPCVGRTRPGRGRAVAGKLCPGASPRGDRQAPPARARCVHLPGHREGACRVCGHLLPGQSGAHCDVARDARPPAATLAQVDGAPRWPLSPASAHPVNPALSPSHVLLCPTAARRRDSGLRGPGASRSGQTPRPRSRGPGAHEQTHVLPRQGPWDTKPRILGTRRMAGRDTQVPVLSEQRVPRVPGTRSARHGPPPP